MMSCSGRGYGQLRTHQLANNAAHQKKGTGQVMTKRRPLQSCDFTAEAERQPVRLPHTRSSSFRVRA